MRLILTTLVFLSALLNVASASEMEDVIYKTDGSILRGELIEQDFAAGKYKIQLMGGSIFSVNRDDISKITREAPIVKAKEQKISPTVNVEVMQSGITNSLASTNETKLSPAPVHLNKGHYPDPNTDSLAPKDFSIPPHVISIARSSRYYQIEAINGDELEATYRGAAIAYQGNFTQHFSVYVDYSRGNFDKDQFEDDHPLYSSSGGYLENSKVTSIQALGVVSTHTGRNRFQFALGAGLYTETLIYDSYSSDADGTVWMMSGGYSWENLQLQLRYFGLNSSDYDDTVENADQLNLEIGWNI